MAYSEDEVNAIFDKIIFFIEEDGQPLRRILRANNMPSSKTFYEWLEKDDIKVKRYAYACELRTEMKFESIEEDYSETPQRDPETGRIDSAWVQLQRLKIDAKKWELAKLNPKKYGDKTDVTTNGRDINTIITTEKIKEISNTLDNEV